ncbi:CPBP family intramembrane glutamic endopeptidase [Streptococcus cameli]
MNVKQFLKGLGFAILYYVLSIVGSALVQMPLGEPPSSVGEIPVFVFVFYVVTGFALLGLFCWLLFKEKPIQVAANPLTKSIWLILGLYVVYMAVQQIFPTISPNQEMAIKMTQGKPVWAFLAIVIAAPIAEELFYRKALAVCFFGKMNNLVLIGLYLFVSSALFAWVHQSATLYQFGTYFTMGIIFGLTYLYKQDIRHSMALHIFNNLLGYLSILFLA